VSTPSASKARMRSPSAGSRPSFVMSNDHVRPPTVAPPADRSSLAYTAERLPSGQGKAQPRSVSRSIPVRRSQLHRGALVRQRLWLYLKLPCE
jgi:hypothetical protein